MPATTSCTPCCAETQTTNVPGPEGDAGSNGTDGINAFTETTANFVVPAIGADVTIFVEDTSWMGVDQPIFIEGPGMFQVATIVNATQITATFLGQSGNVSPAATIVAGSKVSPGGMSGEFDSLSVYAAGTAYSLTNTAALIDFGTTDPSLTITAAGTWLIFARVMYDYNAATFAASRTVTTKLRRTNNTAADLTNGSSAWDTEIITTLSYTARIHELAPIIYTTANNDDVIQLWGSVNTVPSAGSLDAVEASIVALRIA